MSWNEPGNGKDPWKRGDQEPNDLDQIVQNWQRRFGAIFGGGGRGVGAGGSGGGGYVLVILALIAWGVTGFYRVDEA
jgi:membrane protease subunit HflK